MADKEVCSTAGEIAAVLGCSTAKAYELCKKRGFPARKVGRIWYTTRRALLVWVEDNPELLE